jgi:hypothetical protein
MQTISPSRPRGLIPSMARTGFRRRVVKSLTTFSNELLRRDRRLTASWPPTGAVRFRNREAQVADDADQARR